MSLDDWDPHARLLTVEEAARSIDRPASTIRRWLSDGMPTTHRLGRKALILESDLLAWEAKTRNGRNTH